MTGLRVVTNVSMYPSSTVVTLERVRAVFSDVDLECDCRSKLDNALERFAEFEQKRHRRQLIVDARAQATRINGLLDLLRELDEIAVSETDITVFSSPACSTIWQRRPALAQDQCGAYRPLTDGRPLIQQMS
jgi:hypothetical protein